MCSLARYLSCRQPVKKNYNQSLSYFPYLCTLKVCLAISPSDFYCLLTSCVYLLMSGLSFLFCCWSGGVWELSPFPTVLVYICCQHVRVSLLTFYHSHGTAMHHMVIHAQKCLLYLKFPSYIHFLCTIGKMVTEGSVSSLLFLLQSTYLWLLLWLRCHIVFCKIYI